ncbi:cyclic nucleotide-binding domain-containing protein [Thermodesulfobacteriota bacterium]
MLNDESLGNIHELKILRGLSDDQLKMIFTYGQLVRFDSNDIILEEGQTKHPLYIIVKGQVEVFLPKQGKDHLRERPTKIRLTQLVQGDCFGEYSLVDNEPASASVIAAVPCVILKISREHFREILASSAEMAKIIYLNMLKILIKRARKSVEDLNICF